MTAKLAHFINELDPELAEVVTLQWHSFQERCGKEHLPLPQTFLDSLPKVWAASEFVAKACVANPQLLMDLRDDLCRRYASGELRDRVLGLEFDSDESLMQSLRRIRSREAVRITWRNIAGWADLTEVMTTMSELADACVEKALRHIYRSYCERLGTPLAKTDGNPVGMTVLGLGKLGGRELNFSSDIDLIFAYSEAGETNHPRPISNHEFFLKVARSLIGALGTPTADGYVFRVDMRLRPNGESGPLALSFDAMEQYYQTHGRDWERYALIKARNIAGKQTTGKELLTRLQPFVYRRYLDFGAFEAVRSMKDMINRELRRKSVQNNIKLGQGGIREIEFIAQSYQLIRGGREPSLQTNQLFPALSFLGQSGVIQKSVAEELIEAYRFLRNLEHRLQMIRDQQTHQIPDVEIDRKRLLINCDAEDWSDLSQRITDVCDSVHQHFDKIFVPLRQVEESKPDEIRDLWQGLLDSAVAHKALTKLGYADTASAINEMRSLRNSRVYHAHSKYGRERLDKLMPMCIREAGQTPNPDETLKRVVQFVEAVGRRSAYLVLLIENPLALSQLIKLIGASLWVNSWIQQHPLLLDELLDPITAEAASSEQNLIEELDRRLEQVEPDDLEQQMDVLREVCHGQSLRVAAADVSGLIDWVEVGRRLSMVAETMLTRTVDLCVTGAAKTLGRPSVAPGASPATLGIVAYGKLGSMELGYNSDLDIVVLHHGAETNGITQGGERSIGNEQYYFRLVQRIVHILTTRTAAGILYEVDMRLRPSGRAGPIVTSLEGFHNYQLNHAWTWEHQALVRARMIVGPKPLRARFDEIRRDVLCQERDPHQLRLDIREMRQKMRTAHDQSSGDWFDLKHGNGGIVDIEFIVQYYVLKCARKHPELVGPRNNIELIGMLERIGCVGADDGQALAQAYYYYLAAEHHSKLAEQAARVGSTEFQQHREHVEMLWKRLFD
ncbi:MAG: bifunctional [glutamate--ammonia ligase]-adenylyl-L-tyrosine phosphorylase/[glutamate--ammonia-ligase] adenylyltransferase [Arenicellales bacterium]|nr:bifunctional [glutamate--ammonia ligase]-adenylyl-L-tyrosine phosphorylase/[glutamate--ammonia-ligase] adenylyltransferase [Arenicellales bacterium]